MKAIKIGMMPRIIVIVQGKKEETSVCFAYRG